MNRLALLASVFSCLQQCAVPAIGETVLGLYPPDVPAENETTVQRARLGERMFFDGRLSKSGTLSCGSCHRPQYAYSDPRTVSKADGTPRHRRNGTSVLNSAHRRSLGWDGETRTLELQARRSFGPYGDMGLPLADALGRIEHDEKYIRSCREAYGLPVDANCLTRALAAFERSLISASSRFDRYLFGGDQSALTAEEEHGWTIFSGRGACIDCHDVFHPAVNPLGGAYATFSDERFHNLGIGYHDGIMKDPGRYEVTRDLNDFGAFKTPMLRNVSKTAPYMHDGSLESLEAVVAFYNEGGKPNPNLRAGIKPLFLSNEERDALVAFLRALDAGYHVPGADVLASRTRARTATDE